MRDIYNAIYKKMIVVSLMFFKLHAMDEAAVLKEKQSENTQAVILGQKREQLVKAIKKSNQMAVKKYLQKNADVHGEVDNKPVLYHCLECPDIRILDLVLQYGAKPDVDHVLWESPLNYLAELNVEFDKVPHAQLLLQYGASCNKQSGLLGETPLHKAVLVGDKRLVQLFCHGFAARHTQSSRIRTFRSNGYWSS